ncbi:MAG TPA: cupin domain-containing protein [Methylophaga aminisulfidivorans]|uniref:Cupin domain-containing protein n=1 Tax=Methylophaga aminisulfidivorans TaxID=230105 RepID=A0A7C1VQG5_9GAMM|nr:cupin domain-containing protein [Methylophaga aminisulfidivorans]
MTAFFTTQLSYQQFLDEYWQKKPLLIRQAFPGLDPIISPEELAGLACHEDIESRLIEEDSDSGPWRCQHGPFTEDDFARLPEKNWTLLVQDMDKHVPELAAITRQFNFIPEWRKDDLMISYAPEGGSVGPHTDGYDVFLLQAKGTRRWQVGKEPIQNPELIDGLALKILVDFEPEESWDLEPGDMLYLPPHIAHHGIALDACMTFSIGFRAPTQTELLDSLLHIASEQDSFGQQRYEDRDLQIPIHDNEIDQASLLRFRQTMIDCISQSDEWLTSAIGRLLTETKPSLEWLADELMNEDKDEVDFTSQFDAGMILKRNQYIRVAWASLGEDVLIFVAGEHNQIEKSITECLPSITGYTSLTNQDWQKLQTNMAAISALSYLVSKGAWYWDSEG